MASAIRVGVRLPPPSGDLPGWLTGAGAFDAAGADALWLDLTGPGPADPLVVAGALAAVTDRALLVARVDEAAPARALATLAALSRGRLRIATTGGWRWPDGGADPDGAGPWPDVPVPADRAGWRTALAEAAAAGAGGVVVAADERLLDLLRNPGDEGDRRDLHLAVG
jgi:alkanesulfonate monooxygenase SsuD/methylene tetrahydromethanopterin reductase-like flavin-dependent oxidoreductase (luciferase family)